MPKVPKIKVFCLFYITKIDQIPPWRDSSTLDHFSSLHTFIRHFSGGLDHF
jgi:hypothetical protein